ncbi:hypothetical protein [Providencia hangzhouensis]
MKAWMIGVFGALVFSMSLIVGNTFDIEILANVGFSLAWVCIAFYYIISSSLFLALFAFTFGDAEDKERIKEYVLMLNTDNSKTRTIFYLINNVLAIVLLFLSGFIITAVSLAVMCVVSRYLIKVAVRKISCSTVTI